MPGVAELEAAEPVGLGEQDRPVPGAHQEPVLDAALEVAGELLDRGLRLRAVEAVDGHRPELRVVEHALQAHGRPCWWCRARSPGTPAACAGTPPASPSAALRRARRPRPVRGGEVTSSGDDDRDESCASPHRAAVSGRREGGTSLRACPLPSSASSPCRATSASTCTSWRPSARARSPYAGRPSSRQCDGLVLPGGESTTMAKLARIFELFEPLRERIGERAAGVRHLRRDDPARRPDRGRHRRPGDARRPRHHRAPQRVRAPGRLLRGRPRLRRARPSRCTRSSSARRGSRRSGDGVEVLARVPTSRPQGRPPVGSSRSGRAR